MNILSLGDLLLDVVIRYDPLTGEADATSDAVQLWPGGSAANFAVWAARSGADVGFISRVGRDWSGDMLLRSLHTEGVTPHVSVVDGTATGRVLVMVDPEGTRRMWSYPGASAEIKPDDVNPEWFQDLDAFHLTGYSFLREGPRGAAMRALELARTQPSTLCTLDPNPGHLISDYGAARFHDLLHSLQFDIIFPNIDEGRLLTSEIDEVRVARSLLALSPLVVLTLGEAGCLVASQADDASDAQVTVLQADPVEKVVDTTGAGDAFAAGFVIEYLRTRDPIAAAKAAMRQGSLVVARIGAR